MGCRSSRKEEISSDALERQQARLEAAFDALEQQIRTNAVEQQARTDALEQKIRTAALEPHVRMDSVQNYSPDPAPLKRDFSRLAYYASSEIPPDEKPANTVLETMKGLPVGTPVEEIKRASDAFGLDFSFMKAVAKIESGFNPKSNGPDRISDCSSSVSMSSSDTVQETSPIHATMPLPALTNLPRRLCSLSTVPAKNRRSVISISNSSTRMAKGRRTRRRSEAHRLEIHVRHRRRQGKR